MCMLKNKHKNNHYNNYYYHYFMYFNNALEAFLTAISGMEIFLWRKNGKNVAHWWGLILDRLHIKPWMRALAAPVCTEHSIIQQQFVKVLFCYTARAHRFVNHQLMDAKHLANIQNLKTEMWCFRLQLSQIKSYDIQWILYTYIFVLVWSILMCKLFDQVPPWCIPCTE